MRKGAMATETAAQAAKLERTRMLTAAGSAGGASRRKAVVTTTATLARRRRRRPTGRMAGMRGLRRRKQGLRRVG